MSAEFGSLSPTPANPPMSAIQVWLLAITRPSVAAYESIVRDPGASANRAYVWVFVSGLVSYAIALLGQWLLGGFGGSSLYGTTGAGSPLIFVICGVPVGAVLSIVGLMITAGLSQAVAGALGGTGSYSKLAFAIAAYTAPLSLISSVLGVIPYVNCLLVPLAIYGIVLNVTAVKAVNQFSWGKAIVASVVILAGVLFAVACVTIVILALLGPAIGNVFSNIIQEIGTPVP